MPWARDLESPQVKGGSQSLGESYSTDAKRHERRLDSQPQPNSAPKRTCIGSPEIGGHKHEHGRGLSRGIVSVRPAGDKVRATGAAATHSAAAAARRAGSTAKTTGLRT